MALICSSENKEKYINFNVKINVKLAGVSNEDGKEVRKNIQLRFIDSCRFMASSLDKLSSIYMVQARSIMISVEMTWK